jgi:hypothetical protein
MGLIYKKTTTIVVVFLYISTLFAYDIMKHP